MPAVLYWSGCVAGVAATSTGLIAPLRFRRQVSGWLTVLAGLLVTSAGVAVLAGSAPIRARVPDLLPPGGLVLALDPLGAVFVVAGGAVTVAAAWYGIEYSAEHLSGRAFQGLLPLFALTLVLVPAAASTTTFLALWELMAVTSLLVLAAEHRRHDAVRHAVQWYAVMTQLGFVAIAGGFFLLEMHGGGDFAALRHSAPGLPGWQRAAVFVLVLAGFGSKAGMVPLHVWLPRAHPEAPSHVSALMSAAMVALGVYGVVRVGFDVLAGGPQWWWLLVLVLGASSAVFGVLHALVSSDLKRLLAYSTTENVGLAFMGVGTAGLFASSGHPRLGSLALLAALFLVANHAVFKALLFLGAGSVQRATGTRDLDRLGGLMTRMPWTGAAFFVGALAIAGLPPLNGFVGEWLLVQSFLGGAGTNDALLTIAMPVAVAALALTAGLAAATFVKALGIGFLALPRSEAGAHAEEVPRGMRLATGVLALACVGLGAVPVVALEPFERAAAAAGVGGAAVSARGVSLDAFGTSTISPLLVAGWLVVGIVVVTVVLRALGDRRRAETWGCGRVGQTARMEYTATSFAEPLQRVFDDVLRPDLDLDVSHRAESRYYVEAIAVRTGIRDGFERVVYQPVVRAAARWGRAARRIQNGSVHRYLAYGFAVLVVCLVVAR